jgi:hypothetical protein
MVPRPALPLVATCLLTGCSLATAPSFELFGAYFPGWMLCALLGIVGAAGARVILTTSALEGMVPLQFAVCTALGLIVGLLSWMALFR